MVLGAVALLAAAASIARWPVLGAYALVLIEYIRPGESDAGLSAMHVQRVLTIVVIVVVLLSVAFSRRPLARHRIAWALLAMAVAIGVGIPFASWRGAAVDTLIGFARTLSVFFVLVNVVQTERSLTYLVYVFGIAILQAALRSMHGYTGGRASGPSSEYGNANELAALVIFALPYLVLLGLRHRQGWLPGRAFLLVSAIPMLVVNVISNSRAGTMCAVGALGMLVMKSRRRLLSLGICAAVAALAWQSMGQERQARLLSIRDRETDESYLGRVYAWQAARRMFLQHPLVGVGAGCFPYAFYQGLDHAGPAQGHWRQPHNVYYQVLSELGLAGVLSFGAVLWTTFAALRRVRHAWAHVAGSAVIPIAHATEIALVTNLIAGWAGHNLYRFPYYFAAALAMIMDRLPLREASSSAPGATDGGE